LDVLANSKPSKDRLRATQMPCVTIEMSRNVTIEAGIVIKETAKL
jgi:hypothetical protein